MSPLTDHSAYLADDFQAIMLSPGFPYLRLHPALIDPESAELPSGSDEDVLAAMHCLGNRLLVISNRNAYVYEIPHKTSGLHKAGKVGLKVGIGMIPVVGDLLDAGEKLWGAAAWGGRAITGKGRKERRADEARAAQGLPTSKDVENLVWDLRDEDILGMILCYDNRILLSNGFQWKVNFKAPMNTSGQQTILGVELSGVRVTGAGKMAFAPYGGKGWEPLKIAAALIATNQHILDAAGWCVEAGPQMYTVKNFK